MFGARRSLVTLPGVPRVDYRAKTNADSVKRVMSMHAAFCRTGTEISSPGLGHPSYAGAAADQRSLGLSAVHAG